MRIAIIAHALRGGGGVSVGKNIIASFERIAPNFEFLISIPAGLGYDEVCNNIPSRQIIAFHHGGNLLRRYLFEKFELVPTVNSFKPDVVLCLGNVALHNIKFPQALLLHNPYYVYPPQHFGPAADLRLRSLIAFQRLRFSRDLDRINLLFCQTEPMSLRVRSIYKYNGDIQIIPNAVSQFTQLCEDFDDHPFPKALERYRDKRWLFYLTAYYTHKNIELLLKLFSEKSDELKDYIAVITISGHESKAAAQLLRKIIESNLQDRIINVGPLQQNELASYFAHSYALFMPTLLESFSASYLESMYFELPILTSDLDFAHAVCGEAAIYFNPRDLESAIQAIQQVDVRSDDLVALGRMQLSSLFCGWDEIVVKMLSSLETIAT